MDPSVLIFVGFCLLVALMRWLLARADGFTFWSNRPLIGWDAYNARRDAAVAAANAEKRHTEACLAALTRADIEWLKWWGWEAPGHVESRLLRLTRAERVDAGGRPVYTAEHRDPIAYI